ncbi:hypothetical protein JSY36_15015 [Bacillus sp. H-16]|uniref:hypothetical protein n=1 Tax=Alteribacter salitolerans TaxID=2912333 RepID=UPI0019631DE1|nr:hypothetical protein [Alteribacter salitolerans]MBM7097045.1 hypothetical protein [Alteribacter salitolerans]
MYTNQVTERVSSWKKSSVFTVMDRGQVALYDDRQSLLRFKEGETADIQWKWIHLPMKSQNRTINKLIVYNRSAENVDVKLSVRYQMIERSAEVVYYSPSQESLIVHDQNSYALFGGITSQGTQCSYSTSLVNEEGTTDIEYMQMQPIVQFSHGWGLEYKLSLEPYMSGFFYEWEMKHVDLLWLEEAHSQYHTLLRSCQR